MAWFGEPDPSVELDAKIEEATSESIPNGELDIAVGLEITDMIRSKKVPPKTAMRCLKKRLTKVYNNPNLLSSTLKLIDLCVKNCGRHFVAEINSKEFVDYLVDFILKVNYDIKNYQVYSNESKFGVGNQILKLIKEWTLYFKNLDSSYLERQYTMLQRQGYEFPAVDPLIEQRASNFIDSEAPPDWTDGNECAICYTPFSVMNRKHHCRACGNVFCQTHSSKNIPLISLGITQPVRVCDDCYQIHKRRNSNSRLSGSERRTDRSTQQSEPVDDEDEQIKKAIELSLQDSQIASNYGQSYSAPSYPPPTSATVPAPGAAQDDEEMDDDLRAAIEASLKESQSGRYLETQSLVQAPPQQQAQAPPQNQPEPELDFYLNIMLFDMNAYSDAQPSFPNQTGYQNQNQPGYQDQNQTGYQNTNQLGYQNLNKPTGYQNTGALGPLSSSEQMTPAQHIEQHKARVEDLTPQEEEDINLYVQLMHGIKTDRSKQANILYDKDLADLHSKVMRLKPKLNRSLRTAIEKYELFLDMNNKISTITRLYDQFLETKLNQAYSKHYVSSPYNLYGQATGNPNASIESQYTGPNVAYGAPDGQYGKLPVTSQATGPQPTKPQLNGQQTGPRANQQIPSQTTGQQTEPQYMYGGYQQQAGQYQQTLQEENGSPLKSQHTQQSAQRQLTGRQSGIPYPAEEPTPYLSYLSSVQRDFAHTNAPSEPDFEADPSEPDFGAAPSEDLEEQPSKQQYSQAGDYRQSGAGYPSGQFSYPSYPSFESSSDTKLQEPQNSASSYPQEEPQDVSDNESVASRYPPVAGFSDDEVDDSEVPKTHASTRYPELDELDMPQLKKLETSESKKYKSEPEPLIEL
ncbi:CIC11C00000000243 [Sungouiella intermedia]|uniref:Vacuolar protein sorting-associated protein 27 n=1 Tax=Sungouiella intermedia TaxID=45354 RepID=A0A1L0FT90_9ASCO|nr:CIC11C00000000243 [[Candida] intermedia]